MGGKGSGLPGKPFDMDEVRALHSDGLNLREIASKLGVDPARIADAAKGAGLKIRPGRPGEVGGSECGWDVDRAVQLYKEWWTIADVAEEMGVSPSAVQRKLQLLGVTRPRGRARLAP